MLSIHSDEHFMKEALKEAETALELNEVPVGAVVVYKKQIIARAHNQVEMLKDATAHAEMLAITSAANTIGSKYLEDCTLYVTLEPCVMCAGASNWSQILKIVFGASDAQRGFHRFENELIHPKCQVTSGVMEFECADLLNKFFGKLRKA